MKLTGPQQARLRMALVAAFPELKDLKLLVKDQLDVNLPTIVGIGADMTTIVFDLISWAVRYGRLGELIAGARAENPRNPDLLEFLETMGLTAASGTPKSTLEKIVGNNVAFLDVARWREGLEEREHQVGRVECAGEAVGTAFLVGPDLVLTNYHVIESIAGGDAGGWGVRFGYKVASGGTTIDPGTLVDFAGTWQIDSSPYSPLDTRTLLERNNEEPGVDLLDHALIRLARGIGDESRRANSPEPRGFIRTRAAPTTWTGVRGLAILQHPLGGPLKLALGLPPDLTRNATGSRVRYTTPTEPGSSGSPVFDSDWNLIALHHSGDPRIKQPTYNEAIPIDLIAARPAVKAALGL